jgi:hypothetical protein
LFSEPIVHCNKKIRKRLEEKHLRMAGNYIHPGGKTPVENSSA